MIIKKIDPLSAGKITGIVAAAVGLVAGALFFLFSLLASLAGGMAAAANHGSALFGATFGVVGGLFMLILMPIFYGLAGFVGGLLQAFVFNIATRYVGGLHVETE